MAHPDRAELQRLPLAERIQLVENLSDSIAADAERFSSPESLPARLDEVATAIEGAWNPEAACGDRP